MFIYCLSHGIHIPGQAEYNGPWGLVLSCLYQVFSWLAAFFQGFVKSIGSSPPTWQPLAPTMHRVRFWLIRSSRLPFITGVSGALRYSLICHRSVQCPSLYWWAVNCCCRLLAGKNLGQRVDLAGWRIFFSCCCFILFVSPFCLGH